MFLYNMEYILNKSFTQQQISRTRNFDSKLISRQNELNLMADLMRIKYENPKMKQSETANQLGVQVVLYNVKETI